MTIHNPRKSLFSGDLALRAGRLVTAAPLSLHIAPQSSSLVEVPLELPPNAPAGLLVNLTASLHERGSQSDWTWHSELTVRQPFTYSLSPLVNFPLREDQAFPLVHPALASLNLPGEAVLHLRLKNWGGRSQTIKIGLRGDDLELRATGTGVNIPANANRTI